MDDAAIPSSLRVSTHINRTTPWQIIAYKDEGTSA